VRISISIKEKPSSSGLQAQMDFNGMTLDASSNLFTKTSFRNGSASNKVYEGIDTNSRWWSEPFARQRLMIASADEWISMSVLGTFRVPYHEKWATENGT
jgi:hypothetical protein